MHNNRQCDKQPMNKRQTGREAQGTRGDRASMGVESGGRVERTRGGGINMTTSRQTRDFCSGSESDGDDDGRGDGKCRVQP